MQLQSTTFQNNMFEVVHLNYVILPQISGEANTVMQHAGPATAGASSVYDKRVVFNVLLRALS